MTRHRDNSRMDVALEFKLYKKGLKAILFLNGRQDLWLPKSQITIRAKNGKPPQVLLRGEVVTVNLPCWLAKAKGLI